MKTTSPLGNFILVFCYALTGVACVFIAYRISLEVFLFREGISPFHIDFVLAILFGWACGIIFREPSFGIEDIKKRLKSALFMDTAIFAIIIIVPWLITLHTPKKAFSLLWVPLEWYKLPQNMKLCMQVAPEIVALFIFFQFLSIAAFTFGKQKLSLVMVLSTFLLISVKLISMQAGIGRTLFYMLFFCSPFLFAFFGILRNSLRLFLLSLAVATCGVLILAFYTGLLPLTNNTEIASAQGAQKIYPSRNEKSIFPLTYMRHLFVNESETEAFVSYGPTSGIVKISTESGEAKALRGLGLVRYFHTSDASPFIFALDWIRAEWLEINKNKFKLADSRNILDRTLIVPMNFIVTDKNVFVVSTEYPALTKFQRKPWTKTAQIHFKKSGLTKFNSGAWIAAYDERKKQIFVEMGMVDLSNAFLVSQIDAETMRVVKTLRLPEGGLELLAIPEKRALILGSFYSNNLYEISMDTLTVKRIITGPLTCRNLIYDSKRKLLYGTSFSMGNFYVMDYETGKTIKQISCGKKPSVMFLSKNNKHLYLGSAAGIFKINLNKFLEGS